MQAEGVLAGQSGTQVASLGLALLLCTAIGWERQIRQRSAGLRTHTLVGLAAAVFMVLSRHGVDTLGPHLRLGVPGIAAQVVAGIGFIGGGLIFVRRDAVRGLTTAAGLWLTAAVGMACGAELPVLAGLVTATHFGVACGYPPLVRRLRIRGGTEVTLAITYRCGRAALQRTLALCAQRGVLVREVRVRRPLDGGTASASLTLRGGSLPDLVAALAEVDGMESVVPGTPEAP
ncbi:MAG: MgtC/SapB family protein [Actinocatenispora sp.]